MTKHSGKFASTLLCAGLILSACGGSGSIAATTSPVTTPPAASGAPRGTLLADVFGAYPRVVRQSHHQNAALNGRLVASMSSNDNGVPVGAIFASSDEGKSFSRIGTIADPGFKQGQCCGTLYELPVKIGALPAGTLLYATSWGADQDSAPMENRIYQSADGGASWRYLSLCGKGRIAKNHKDASGIWEPEFAIAKSGELMCYYSDETLTGHSQILVEVSSRDGINWSAPQTIVAGDDPNARPGMPIVRQLPSGSYLLTFENCYGGPLDCALRAKRSADGISWGAPNDPGFRLETASGQFFRHAPTFTWAPLAGQPNGMLIAIGQILVDKNGVPDASGNGKVMFTNTSADGSGPWQVVTAPLALATPPLKTNWCQNYSSPLLPSVDGKTLFMLQTDGGEDNTCRTRFGSAALTP